MDCFLCVPGTLKIGKRQAYTSAGTKMDNDGYCKPPLYYAEAIRAKDVNDKCKDPGFLDEVDNYSFADNPEKLCCFHCEFCQERLEMNNGRVFADGAAWDVFVRDEMPYWRKKSDEMMNARKQRNARASAKRRDTAK